MRLDEILSVRLRARQAVSLPHIVILFLFSHSAGAAQNVAIRLDGGAYRISGWNASTPPAAGWSSIFSVYAGEGDLPPMLGSYTMEGGSLTFRPRYPPSGVRTRAVFRLPGQPAIEAVFERPQVEAAPSTRVERVYPSTNLLPDNQLKFYVHFSAPMRRGEAWQRIHLLDQKGSPVELPFLEVDQELWDRDYKRLTVLFDPGRIKRGLAPLAEVGPAIESGKQYTLVIDREWRDARGAPLEAGFRKPFRVGPADRNPPDTSQWRLSPPKAGTRETLVVHFPKPLDYALLMRLLDVPGMSGTVTVGRDETEWRFAPDAPWKPGPYKLVVDRSLEDLAGNRIGRPFDVDTFERVSERLSRETVALPFEVR